jgi:hypothetical protein
MPVSIFTVVDLPAPFSPMSPTLSPRRISKLGPSTATNVSDLTEKYALRPPRKPSPRGLRV